MTGHFAGCTLNILQFNEIVCVSSLLPGNCASICELDNLICTQMPGMKYLLFIFLINAFQPQLFAQQEDGATRIFIVRHAEKEKGNDPLLTAAGNKRAGDLLRTLQQEGIQKIYVSKYRRTQNTADSMRIQLGIDTVHYLADTFCYELLNSIMQHKDFGKTILVIAHSNTIPHIIRRLGVADHPYRDIPDHEYDNLFLVTYKKEKAKLKKMKYGAASGPSAAMN
jgi:phosphohistidine phosphatase SixA